MPEVDECSSIATIKKSNAVANREEFEKSLVNLWGHSAAGIEAKKAAMTMLSTKTGMYTKVPIICKGDACPYHVTCLLLPYDLAPIGEACPTEAALIEIFAAGYEKDFEYDKMSFTDKSIVRELVAYDIMLERCKAIMAGEGTMVNEIVIGVNENGVEYKQPAVTKALEAHDKIMRRRMENYQLMMATRHDKKKDGDHKEKSIAEILADATQDAEFSVIEERPDHLKEGAVNAKPVQPPSNIRPTQPVQPCEKRATGPKTFSTEEIQAAIRAWSESPS